MSFGGTPSRARKWGLVALLALGVFVSTARPITRPLGDSHSPRGLRGWNLLAEVAADDGMHVTAPAVAEAHPVEPVPAPALLHRSTTTQQTVSPPLLLHRRTLPPPRSSDSPSS